MQNVKMQKFKNVTIMNEIGNERMDVGLNEFLYQHLCSFCTICKGFDIVFVTVHSQVVKADVKFVFCEAIS
jgi:hypothetical protein